MEDTKKIILDYLKSLNVPKLSKAEIERIKQDPNVVYLPSNIDLGTVRFVKFKEILHCQIYLLTYEDKSLGNFLHACILRQGIDGKWEVAWGFRSNGAKPSLEATGQIHASFGGGGIALGKPGGYWGGYVTTNAGIAKVQLITANNITLEDSVNDDLVLFITDQPVTHPILAKLLDAKGNLIAQNFI